MLWSPHAYQERAIVLQISQGGAGLLLDPGLGKTSISLASFKILKEKGLAKKMLVVTPKRPAYLTWPREIEKWDQFQDLRWCHLHGSHKDYYLNYDADVYITTPDMLKWLFGYTETKKKGHVSRFPIDFDVLCVDESTKFKSYDTQRFRIIKEVIYRFNRRWILTGTPTPKGVMDLFGQCYILDSGRALGRYITHYRRDFFHNPSAYDPYTWVLNDGAFDKIMERVRPLTIRLAAKDYLQMPEVIINDIYVQLPDSVRALYTEVEKEYYALVGGDVVEIENTAVLGNKLRQVANGALYVTNEADYLESGGKPERRWVHLHDEKLEALVDLIDELQGAPVIVIYEFIHDFQRIMDKFPQAKSFTGLSEAKMDALEREFNEGKVQILVGHGGSVHGLNLQAACNHIIWFGITWNLEYYQQANGRIYRQGQKEKTVYVHRIVAEDTKDEDVLLSLEEKDNVQEAVLRAQERT